VLSQIDQLRQSPTTSIVVAAISSLFFALLFWIWEQEALWMLAVLLPPIWSPVIYQRLGNESDLRLDGRARGVLLAGLVLLLGLGALVYLTS
jgi:hypothetical protein